jgi:hypothetical protein
MGVQKQNRAELAKAKTDLYRLLAAENSAALTDLEGRLCALLVGDRDVEKSLGKDSEEAAAR